MATDIYSQWAQVRTIMDGYQARIQRLDSETEAMHIELESIEQRGATILQAIDAAAKQRIKLVEAMEAMARRISQGVLDSTVPARVITSPSPTSHPPEMLPARAKPNASQESNEDHIPAAVGSNLPATPASMEAETTTFVENEDDDEHNDDDDNDSDDAAFSAMNARTSNSESALKRKRLSSPVTSLKAITSTGTTVRPTRKRIRKTKNSSTAACIHPDFPTIVATKDGSGWLELRCDYCGGNTSVAKTQTLLKGILGFRTHFAVRHSDKVESEVGPEQVYEHASYCNLTQEQSTKILAGDLSAYYVPKVAADIEKCTKRSKAKDEAAKG
ncbi:hypothetical protein LTR10_003029 [Elasticomyces elasticus]|nr:hypothetical protein LTR10_003029 [Elasticomyces elasticus]KAK4967633.1 hypothetical protein LTR42_009958 [Elasticomyces elasticus]